MAFCLGREACDASPLVIPLHPMEMLSRPPPGVTGFDFARRESWSITLDFHGMESRREGCSGQRYGHQAAIGP
jgi:hypothetical protein